MEEVRNYCMDMINKYPQFEEEIHEYYQLFLDEVEDGESVNNEFTHLKSSINDLITN